ncbi:hypothetical protein D3C72_1036730 [compost metagenome]
MRGVDAHLERLQPVAFEQALEREGVGVGRDEAVEVGEGRGLALADVREDDAGLLDHRVGRLLDAAAQLAGGGLGRSFQAVALGVEQPAVEGAADAAVFQPAEGQVGAAVRAVAVEHAELAALVAEQHEVLAHELHGLDRARARQFVGQGHRLPVAAQQLAGGCAGSDAGDEIVLLGADHRAGSIERSLSEGLQALHAVVCIVLVIFDKGQTFIGRFALFWGLKRPYIGLTLR